MVTQNTKICDLFKDSSALKYKNNLYYGWNYENDEREIGSLIKEVWPNDDIVKSLNRLEEMDKSGVTSIIHFHQNKDINFISISHHDNRRCVLIYSGGGYCNVCNAIEALPIAMHLYDLGYDAFIGTYAINERARNGGPTKDIIDGISYLTNHAKKLNIDMKDYLVGGFSAGGHAVAELLSDNLGFKKNNLPLPSLMFLGYPVITMNVEGVSCTRNLLLGQNPAQEEKDYYSVDKHINEYLDLKVYFWQCEKDNTITFNNSLLLEKALQKVGISYIFNHYDSNAHGWGIATNKLADGWVDEMINFSKQNGKIEI